MSTVNDMINDHISHRANPHKLTRAQVGLKNIHDYPLASIPDAEEGLRDDRYVTPRQLKHSFNGFLKANGLMDLADTVINPSDSYHSDLDPVNPRSAPTTMN